MEKNGNNSGHFIKLIKFYQREDKKSKPSGAIPTIRVSRAASAPAFFYERFRNVIDYKEEHLLRKNAVVRFLRRKLFAISHGVDIAESLIRELIWGRYLENNKVPESKIQDVAQIIDKYLLLIKSFQGMNGKLPKEMREFISDLASCEIEENLAPAEKDEAMASFAYSIVRPHVILPENTLTYEETDIQSFIAVRKALLKYDEEMLAYKIFNLYYPDWKSFSLSQDNLDAVAEDILEIKEKIGNHLSHKIREHLYRYTKRRVALFWILQDIMNEENQDPERFLRQPYKLEVAVKKACQKRYKEIKGKMSRRAIRSILYIFATKMLLAFILEMPIDFYLEKHLNYLSLGINLLTPPFLMFLVTLSIRAPDERNTRKIVKGVKNIVFEKGKDIVDYRQRRKIPQTLKIVFLILYFVTFGFTFGGIIYVLISLGFNIASIAIFIFFLSVVSFFGYGIYEAAKELVVVDRKESVFLLLFDFVSFPILRTGRWLSQGLGKINVFLLVFDVIIEAPFKSLVKIAEEWFSYVREQREDIV